jgi:hypothetical protein
MSSRRADVFRRQKPSVGRRFTTSIRRAPPKAGTLPQSKADELTAGGRCCAFPVWDNGSRERQSGWKTSSRPWLGPQLRYILRAIVSLVFGKR